MGNAMEPLGTQKKKITIYLLLSLPLLLSCNANSKLLVTEKNILGANPAKNEASQIELKGLPSSLSKDSLLNVAVLDDSMVNYTYLIKQSDFACPDPKTAAVEYEKINDKDDPIVAELNEDGPYTLCVVSINEQGDFSEPERYSWIKDIVPPAVTLLNTPTNPTAETSIDVTVQSADATYYKYALVEADACTEAVYSDWIVPTIHIAASSLVDGTRTLCVKAKDAAGNETLQPTFYSWTQGTEVPQATLTGTPSANSNDLALNVTVAGNNIVSYQFAVLEPGVSCIAATYSTWLPVATSITSALGTDGNKLLCVLGKNLTGSIQQLATSYAWLKDTVAPTSSEITISGAPNDPSNVTTLAVTIGGTGVVNYKYALTTTATACSAATYNGSWIGVATQITDPIGSDGLRRLCVIGQDAASNATSVGSAKNYDWTQNTAAPTATLSGTPTSSSPATSLDVTVAGTNVVSYQYALIASGTCAVATYNGSWIVVATHITDSLGTDGNYTICAIAKDTANNVQAVGNATSYAWAKDTVSPTNTDITLVGAPSNPSSATTLDVTVGGGDVVSYKYSVDVQATACTAATYSASWILIATHITDTIGADGDKRLCVLGKDAAGNTTLTSVAEDFAWTKDTVAPTAAEISLTTVPANPSVDTTLNVTVAGTGVAKYKYILTNQATTCAAATPYSTSWIDVATPITDSIGADGNQRLCVIGQDLAGNGTAVASAKQADWTKDTTAPTLTVFTLSDQSDNSTTIAQSGTVNVNFTSSEGSSQFCVKTTNSAPAANDACWSATNPQTVAITATQGTSTTRYGWTKDAAGNISTSAASASITYSISITISANTTWSTDKSYNNITVNSGAILTINGGLNISAAGTITITANSTIIVKSVNNTAQISGSWQGAGSTLNAANVTIDSGSKITANDEGYIACKGPGTVTSATSGAAGAGASHLGRGGYGNAATGGAPAATYGSLLTPTTLGSGGSSRSGDCVSYPSGAGGGAIRLIVSGTLTLNGTITANAGSGSYGAGSGGSIYATVGTLTGAGTFNANGGTGSTNGPGGAGGIVAVYYTTLSSYTGLSTSTATGGVGGTAYTLAGAQDGSLGSVGFYSQAVGSVTNLTVYKHYLIPPDASNTFTNVTVGAAGATGATLALGGGSTLTVSSTLTVTQNSTVLVMGKNISAQVSGSWQGAGATINAANATIDSGSSLSANAQGYIRQAGPGSGSVGACGSGGTYVSYGGIGGPGCGGTPVAVGSLYGSLTAPTDLGSGGACDGGNCPGYPGASAGGAIRLNVTSTLTVDGTISTNGAAAAANAYAGGGTGGSIYATVGTLTGSGNFTANGGAGTAGYGGGASGGRVAIYATSASGFSGGYSATGGTGYYAGGSGTIFLSYDSLCNSGTWATTCTISSSKTIVNGVTIGGSGNLVVASGGTITTAVLEAITINVTGNVTVQNGGTISASLNDLVANNVTVDSTGTIDVSGRGTQGTANAGTGTGGGVYGGGGGSYGGKGGYAGANGESGVGYAPGAIYGSETAPVDFGGVGGGYVSYGGHAGGKLKLTVANTLTVNGSIKANGGNSGTQSATYGAGGGSGGSIFITTVSIAGSGTIAATGGNGGTGSPTTNSGAGGGGGRIAFISNSKFSGTFSYNGGSGPGSAGDGDYGTIYFSNPDNYCSSTGTLSTTCTITQFYQFASASTLTSTGDLVIASGGVISTKPTESMTISVSGNFTIQSGGKIQANLTNLTANNFTIDAGGSLDVSRKGSVGTASGVGAGTGGGAYGGGGASEVPLKK